ncbi:MAG: hypothetical protein HY689_11165 [Chloroflexi bacterium]|nr:hypothetical protein [Chloroflexota bacterium]
MMSLQRSLWLAGALTAVVVAAVLGVGARLGAFGLGETPSPVAAEAGSFPGGAADGSAAVDAPAPADPAAPWDEAAPAFAWDEPDDEDDEEWDDDREHKGKRVVVERRFRGEDDDD